MCGRFAYTQKAIQRAYQAIFNAELSEDVLPDDDYNTAPTDPIPVFRKSDGKPDFTVMRWGIIPAWSKGPGEFKLATFNAKIETLEDKPTYRNLYRKRHAIIPALGYYEWVGPKGKGVPHFISRTDGEVILFAGLWERWRRGEQEIESATIVLGNSNEALEHVHDRMPRILEPDQADDWLAGAPKEMLQTPGDDTLQAWPVNPVRGNSPNLIEPAT